MVKDYVILKTVQTSIYVVNTDGAESQSSRVGLEHGQREEREKKECVRRTEIFWFNLWVSSAQTSV